MSYEEWMKYKEVAKELDNKPDTEESITVRHYNREIREELDKHYWNMPRNRRVWGYIELVYDLIDRNEYTPNKDFEYWENICWIRSVNNTETLIKAFGNYLFE